MSGSTGAKEMKGSARGVVRGLGAFEPPFVPDQVYARESLRRGNGWWTSNLGLAKLGLGLNQVDCKRLRDYSQPWLQWCRSRLPKSLSWWAGLSGRLAAEG